MSKFVNILTIHNEPNYGALLQAYALYHTIEELGYKPRLINLSMQYRRREYNILNRILTSSHNHLKGYSYCYDLAENFCKTYEPNQIGPFFNIQQLEGANWNQDDIFIVGSDQVWNPAITQKLANAFTLSFLPKYCKKKFSYASSFGNIKNDKERAEQLDIRCSIGTFQKIGVRERFGVDFLNRLGIQAIENLDPTLLLEDYSHLIEENIKTSQSILYLSLGKAPKMDAFVSEVTKKLKMPLEIRYGYLHPRRSVNLKWLTVGQWLQRIASSELIITDSFHASVFSIIFERPFYVYISDSVKSARITNLLELLGLSDRIVSDISQVNKNQEIDYIPVKEKLKLLRTSSLQYLKEILK